MHETPAQRTFALVAACVGHALIILLAAWSSNWLNDTPVKNAGGEPIQATLQVTKADIKRAQQAIAQAQPLPAPRPQTSEDPLQRKAQEVLDQPDKVDQEAISALGTKPSPPKPEQQEKRRQEQVNLTQDVEKQKEIERQQRLRQQLLEIQKLRAQAEKNTQLQQQRTRQLAELHAAKPAPVAPKPGPDPGLGERYVAALKATAQSNWITVSVPAGTRIKVMFHQIPGGEVLDVQFIGGPYDAQVRESVERALMRTPMPYSGFESVFAREVKLEMCYPEELCQ